MKTRTIKDTSGDTAEVQAALGFVSVDLQDRDKPDNQFSMLFTVEQSRALRKALKRAEREIGA